MIDGVGREQEYCSVLGSVNTHFMIDYFHRGVYSIVFVLMGPFGSARLRSPKLSLTLLLTLSTHE